MNEVFEVHDRERIARHLRRDVGLHLYEIGDELRKYDNIQFFFFETSVQDDQLLFSYQLKEGVSNDRLGYLILRREGVVGLLEKL